MIRVSRTPIVSLFISQTARNKGSTNPCDDASTSTSTSSIVAALCQAMAQHDITQALLDIDIPTSLCHSPDDNVVTIGNLPSDGDVSGNTNLELYEPSFSFLRPMGNHFSGAVACAIDPITTYRITNLNQPLDNPPATCPSRTVLPVCGTLAPTPTPPTVAPVVASGSNKDDSSANKNGLFISLLVGFVVVTVAVTLSM
jgi:hypothetical protein